MYRTTWTMPFDTMTNIDYIFSRLGVPHNMVEIGTYEGYTSVCVSDKYTEYNPNFKIYAIDPHEGSIDMSENFDEIKSNFLYNISISKYKNIEYIDKKSEDGLLELINKNVPVEFIYIDGDHRASTVLSDLVLSFKLLIKGGIILCDDATDWKYTDKNGTTASQMSPRMAIETFIMCNWDKIEIVRLPNMSQTGFLKL